MGETDVHIDAPDLPARRRCATTFGMPHRYPWPGICSSTTKKGIPRPAWRPMSSWCRGSASTSGAPTGCGRRAGHRPWSSRLPHAGPGWKTWVPSGRVRHAWGAGSTSCDDPLGEYLRPPLQGYRLHEGEYQRLPPAGEEGLTGRCWVWRARGSGTATGGRSGNRRAPADARRGIRGLAN